jgi:hypothetical protein
MRGNIGHRHLWHFETFKLAAAPAANLEVDHYKIAPACLVNSDDKEEKNRKVNRNRQRERAAREVKRPPHVSRLGAVAYHAPQGDGEDDDRGDD